ncbi:hypothetical protein F4819DRAFT_112175 [Hypoxylon fuscum]|nr:hypothetical protein F4819DRAFT_112175 [Hypoxylon fuscum]
MLSRTVRHTAPLRSLVARQSGSAQPNTTAIRTQQLPLQRTWQRFSSSQPPQPSPVPEEGSLNKQFFKNFGRPIAKVFLLAIFTYQVTYYFWTRAEQDEIKSEMRATISALEARIEQLEKAK